MHQALAGVRVVSDAGRADLAGGVPDGEFSGLGCGDLAPGDDVTGADETWLHHLGVHPAQPKLPAEARVDKAHGLAAEAVDPV